MRHNLAFFVLFFSVICPAANALDSKIVKGVLSTSMAHSNKTVYECQIGGSSSERIFWVEHDLQAKYFNIRTPEGWEVEGPYVRTSVSEENVDRYYLANGIEPFSFEFKLTVPQGGQEVTLSLVYGGRSLVCR
jgi:hypothetical protein